MGNSANQLESLTMYRVDRAAGNISLQSLFVRPYIFGPRLPLATTWPNAAYGFSIRYGLHERFKYRSYEPRCCLKKATDRLKARAKSKTILMCSYGKKPCTDASWTDGFCFPEFLMLAFRA